MVKKSVVLAVVVFVAAISAMTKAQHSDHESSPYAGLQDRDIKSLSAKDVDDIRKGSGWGLALSAELNGLPGPAHLLELKDELDLSPVQVAQIQTLFDDMRSEAITAGEAFIEAERALSIAFQNESLDQAQLTKLVASAAQARGNLRNIHLARHLMTPAILSPDQIRRYGVLRGYQDDPCAAVPEGHNADMWRRHNNCE